MKFLGLLLLLVIAIVIQRYLKKRKLAKYKGEYVEAFPYDRPPLAYAYLKTYRFTRLDHLIHYFILKWISERRIHPRTYKGGIFKKRDKVQFLILKRDDQNLPRYERDLLSMFISAANRQVLTTRQVNKYLTNGVGNFIRWEEKLIRNSLLDLTNNGIVSHNFKKLLGKLGGEFGGVIGRTIGSTIGQTNIVATESDHSQADFEGDLYRFRNYISEFSTYHRDEKPKLRVANRMLVSAALIGDTKKALEQIKQVFPDFDEKARLSSKVVQTAKAIGSRVDNEIRKYERQQERRQQN